MRTRKRESNDGHGGGRPKKPYIELCHRNQQRQAAHGKEMCLEELYAALESKLRSEKKTDELAVIKELQKSPTRPTQILQAYDNSKKIKLYNPEEALALMMDANLTVHQYSLLKEEEKAVYPPYYKVQAAKKECLPANPSIDERCASVKLQDMLDHTVRRLVKVQKEVIKADVRPSYTLISKWGLDGSSGHSRYKQKSQNDFDDSNMFVTSIVPLQLYSEENGVRKIVWQNKKSSSPRFCRPLRIAFEKETTQSTREQVEKVNAEIEHLMPSKIPFGDGEISISHSLHLTMVDGKVVQAVTNTSSAAKCYICDATPNNMNDPKVFDRPVKEDHYQYGLSVLHARMRFMDWICNLSFKLPYANDETLSKEEKKILIEQNKKRIQKEVHDKMNGLNIFVPTPGGSGNSNDGNTARRFFENYILAAECTGVNVEMLEKCHYLLTAISTDYELDDDKITVLCREIWDMYVDMYAWHKMPVTVHKVLVHGPYVIRHCFLPIGMMSEEAQETRNKHLKQYREHFSRKSSRINTITDVFNRLLVTSDPYILSLRSQKCWKVKRDLPPYVLTLLKPSPSTDSDSDSDSES